MLRELQRRFAADVEQGDPRVAIYRENLSGGLVQALSEVYPVCRALVGEAFFDALAARFGAETPSTSPDLNDYGEGLAAFLDGFEPARALPYLPDVARLEWLCHRAFHAADAPDFDLDALADVHEAEHGDLRFELTPSLELIDSRYPVSRIWSIHQGDPAAAPPVDLGSGPERCAVWRQGLEVRVEPLDEDAWTLLEAFARRTPLADAATALERPEALAQRLQEAVALGQVVGFTTAGASGAGAP